MAEQKNDGGPAFPFPRVLGAPATGGMTLRDYFAAKAMHALMSDRTFPSSLNTVAKVSYNYADAMLAARDGVK